VNRLESLDWLRGLLALSIMLYHLTGWTLYQPDSSGMLGRLGIYGVSMFFVLSGLSMAVGYHAFIRDVATAARFFVRRIFRIWPLLWLAVLASTFAGGVLRGREVDWALVLLNLTTLFGFVAPGAYINTGAWSIGNEMVYYALTPAFIVAYRHRLWLGNFLVGVTWVLGLYFGLVLINREGSLADQWYTYIHPANNLCFYTAGLALYFNLRDTYIKPSMAVTAVLLAMALLAAWPAQGDLIRIVTGTERIVFFIASVMLVFGFYKLAGSPPSWIARPLAAMGVATYGVYLLHPLVFGFVELLARRWRVLGDPAVIFCATVMLTIVVALVLYDRFEAPFIRLGKRLTKGPVKAGPLDAPEAGRPV
jgi:exopolysaccharide production protein ExoZ